MGEAKRRRDRGEQAQPSGIKISPRKREAGFRLAHHNRVERQTEDGVILAQNVFRVIDDEGNSLMEETPDGLMPVLLMSVPQPVRRSLLTTQTPTLAVVR